MTEYDPLRSGVHLGDLMVAALRRHRDHKVLELGDTELTGGEMADAVSRYVQAFESVGAGSEPRSDSWRSTVRRYSW